MIEKRYFDRFYAVFWRVGVAREGGGSWNYAVTDTKTGSGITGVVKGLSKASFRQAQAKAVHWAMVEHNKAAAKKRGGNLGRIALLV